MATNISTLRAKTQQELFAELKILLREQFNLRIQRGFGQPVKPHLFGNVRRNIARVKTLLKEKADNNE